MNTTNEKTIQLVRQLSDAFGPSGKEDEVRTLIKDELDSEYVLHQDSIGNLYVSDKAQQETPAVLLDAHLDEVGMMVQSVEANGTIAFLPLGGWDPVVLPGTSVIIEKKSSDEPFQSGIIASVPVHFQQGPKEPGLQISSLRVDVGASDKEETLSWGIMPGCFMTSDVKCSFDEKRNLFKGKAFDDRIGCAAEILTLHELPETLRPFVQGLFTAQEEVGERGMMAAVDQVSNCKLAICFEGCPADDTIPGLADPQSSMNKGIMIRAMDRSMITEPHWIAFAAKTAQENHIPLQIAARAGGGTNGGILHTHNIPTIVIGIPVRYAHTPVGYCSKNDLEDAVKLSLAIIEKVAGLKEGTVQSTDPNEQWVLDQLIGNHG